MCLVRIDGHETLFEQEQRVRSSTVARINAAHESEQQTPDYGICEKLAGEKSKVVASNVDRLLASISLLAKDDCVGDLSSDVPSCRAKTNECVCAQSSQKHHSTFFTFA